MRYKVVLSGFDSKESATIQQDLHFPIVLPGSSSYGATIIDGLSNTFIFGGNVSNTLEIVLCSPIATIRYMCRLYEHDDKTVGEMDDIALHDLSFVEIDD